MDYFDDAEDRYPINVKITCRSCLTTNKEVAPMAPEDIEAYYTFLKQPPAVDNELSICLTCKYFFKRLLKFIEQCQRANEILSNVKLEENTLIFMEKLTLSHNMKVITLDQHYFGPELMNDEGDEMATDDHHGDDDDIPLVMLKHNRKKRKKSKNACEIKQETDIEQEPQETCKKKGKCKEKELRDGFSSRMVQETNEYIVIKLTKEQVMQDMVEKAKTEAYLRAPYKCELCVKGFNFEDVLKSHLEKHTMEHGSFKCDICTQYCPSSVSLRGHIKSHTTRYQCKLCGQIRLSRQHLLEHHAITHTNAATDYKCDKCNFITNKRTVIQRHVKSHAASEQHACHRCGKLFKTIESLRVHTMRHDKTSRVQCHKCDKQFIYPSLLHKHVAAVHEREDYYCVECDVKFKSPESLKLHFKKAKRHRDSSSYKYQCPQCPQRFVSQSTLSVHMTGTHGVAKQYRCAVCRRHYSSRDATRTHQWRAHANVRRTVHACSLCDHTFTRKSTLKVHLRTHTGDRPYVCECGSSFAQKSTLTAHYAAKHQKHELPNGMEVLQEQET